MNYFEQSAAAEARHRRQIWKDVMFYKHYGRNATQLRDAVVIEGVTVREASYLMWVFLHPFGLDLAACSETNS